MAVLVDADGPLRGLALPAGRGLVEDVAGVGAVQEFTPRGEDLLQDRVDPRVAVGREAGVGSHRPIQNGAQRQRHRLVTELGRHPQHRVDQPQQLPAAGEVPLLIVPGVRDLLDHPLDIHPHHRIRADQLLKLQYRRV
jgi:hypothetical protein